VLQHAAGTLSDNLRRNPDMFSIPVAGLAKAAIAVTISLHPAAAHRLATRVRPTG
jgi:hypothetical protein